MVGDTRFELVTPAVSRQCSPPELTAHFSVDCNILENVAAGVASGKVCYQITCGSTNIFCGEF